MHKREEKKKKSKLKINFNAPVTLGVVQEISVIQKELRRSRMS